MTMVKRTVALSFGTFAWEEAVPLFLADTGAPTLEDTGTPALRRDGVTQRMGRVTRTANRGEEVMVPVEVSERGDALGAFEVDGQPVDDLTALTDDELIAWLGDHTLREITAAVGADRALAARSADAEELRETSRASVVKALRKLADAE